MRRGKSLSSKQREIVIADLNAIREKKSLTFRKMSEILRLNGLSKFTSPTTILRWIASPTQLTVKAVEILKKWEPPAEPKKASSPLEEMAKVYVELGELRVRLRHAIDAERQRLIDYKNSIS